ncbi:MAG: DEAD/DEAH box helicase [Leptolyngbyaceae cyanobacterium CRU_2_3]|nr:DEAD/DEAH box helicase [Leptolyngbyaceae cyanobacterium CRU_2_3]
MLSATPHDGRPGSFLSLMNTSRGTSLQLRYLYPLY